MSAPSARQEGEARAVATAVGLLAAGLGCIAAAHAAPAPPRAAVRLDLARGPGADACPGEAFLRAEVARALGADPFEDGAPRVLSVRVAQEGPELTASLALRDPQGETQWAEAFSTRSGCEELLSGVALAIVAQLLSAPEQAPPPDASPGPAPSPASAPSPSPAPAPSPAPSPPPPQAQRASREPPPRPALPPARSQPEAAPAPAERPQIEAGLGATLGLGITPGPAAGMTLSFGVRRSDWSIAVEGRGLVSLAPEVEAMPLGKRAFTAAALACHRGRTLFACGVVTAGVVRFVPRDPWNVLSPTQPLLGIGPRLGAGWPLSDRWSASTYAEAVWIVADAVLRRQKDGREPPAPVSWSSPAIGAAFGFGVTATY
ncbi:MULTISPECIES: hypothetical protein [Sorangium]|uniref:Uncharacterized protein n=1 Tax=Sorangium cellulosum TaxID=56 RepID=A0A4P2QT71_SORCE|nr:MULTISPECIES: hypothetical protein [Sorangium]AUX33524.1 hypothetical protein SOCE836_056840 [Sorangium cellulosum]WCQ92840.1 hypothetical protein NQZ70_05586 [Sorangium sp. Soce836]